MDRMAIADLKQVLERSPLFLRAGWGLEIAPTKTALLKNDRPPQPRHEIAEGRLQIQPLAQSQTVVQLLKQMLDQGETETMDSADWL
jgi:hypothetical protein